MTTLTSTEPKPARRDRVWLLTPRNSSLDLSSAADPGRNAEGTFKFTVPAMMTTKPSEGLDPSRNADGTFKSGSAATSPDNFANRSTEEVQELGREGGKAAARTSRRLDRDWKCGR